MTEVQVAFGSLEERYVGQSIRAAVQVTEEDIQVRMRFPLLEPGMSRSITVASVAREVETAEKATVKVMTGLVEHLRATIGYIPGGAMTGAGESNLSLSKAKQMVFIDTTFKITAATEISTSTQNPKKLTATIRDFLKSEGLELTFFQED